MEKIVGLHVGADAEQVKAVLPELSSVILAILNTSAGDDVKKKALDMLNGSYEVKNVTVSDCTFYTEPREDNDNG